jgi:undecaprenyl-diphosphatase
VSGRRRVLVGLAAGAAAVFALLAAAYPRGGVVGDVDEDVARWVAESLPVWVEWAARPFSWLGGAVGLALVSVVAAWWLAGRGRRRDAALLLLAYAGSQLSMLVVKGLFDRPRPDLDPAVPLPASDAFPSGHAVGGVSVVVLAALLLAPAGRVRPALAAGAALAVAVGASRVALGVHWVSDVVAGWAFGLVWLAACLLLRARR